ncbi:hypothetical protein F7725_008668 [Dissostichus mawsoni]|uniref:Uncharacterized protein n=1 Tax=Dissostichus mawsoni TaxID=36200 RepID=A0A7J5Y7U2_DISMA|nr:hypothetical protein F7725_008668 [Dissostichus mawsoni]
MHIKCPVFWSSGTEEFWGQRSEVFHRTSFSSPTNLEIRQELASSGSSKMKRNVTWRQIMENHQK